MLLALAQDLEDTRMFSKPAATAVPIASSLAHRWSGRAYDPERPVARDDLIGLLEAARWAPSCYGDQPWRFIVGDRGSAPEVWQRLLDCLVEGNRAWAAAAPVLIAVVADSAMSRDDTPNPWGGYDTGAAAMALSVEATIRGLMVHQMGGFDVSALRAAFRIPERYLPMSVMAVGYQLPVNLIPADLQAREHAARSRRPLETMVYTRQWGEAWSPHLL